MPRLVLAAVVAVAVLTGCSAGADCGSLAALTAERDAARADWQQALLAQQAGQGTAAEADASHDDMHGLDTRTFALEQSCAKD